VTPTRAKISLLEKAAKAGQLAENTILVLLLSAMILLASTQIFLRNFLSSGIPWADEALRLIVLWLAMFGAIAASREERHISIDVLSKMLPARGREWAAALVNLFTATVSLTLAWYSWFFVADSYAFEDLLLESFPAWVLQSVLPIGFFLIVYRYAVLFLNRAATIITGAGKK